MFVARVWHTGFLANYRDYRANLGRGILIGLELLIAADILKSVVVDPTLQGIAVLGGIVAIRTFLSISLDVEINGHWPWETTRLAQQARDEEKRGASPKARPDDPVVWCGREDSNLHAVCGATTSR